MPDLEYEYVYNLNKNIINVTNTTNERAQVKYLPSINAVLFN